MDSLTGPHAPPDGLHPTQMAELTMPEALVVWAFRRWALGLRCNAGAHWNLVWSEFTRHFGAGDAKTAMSGFLCFCRELQCSGRRTILHHQPCCPCLGADELWVIGFLGACQRGDRRLSRALAEWMVSGDGAGGLIEAGRRLGVVMARHGLDLPARRAGGADRARGRSRPAQPFTVH